MWSNVGTRLHLVVLAVLAAGLVLLLLSGCTLDLLVQARCESAPQYEGAVPENCVSPW